MAVSSMHYSTLNCNFGKVVLPKAKHVTSTRFKAAQTVCYTATISEPMPVIRRSGNYQPCIWDNDYFQSLRSDYADGRFNELANKLKEDVLVMLKNVVKPLDQLELINHLQRLGVAHLFEEDIDSNLQKIYNHHSRSQWELIKEYDLHSTALEFRLLRRNKYFIPEDIFKRFTDNDGRFKECISEDVKGMVSLYEASYCSYEGESLMEEAYCFTNKNLKEVDQSIVDPNLVMHVKHSLELPLHWRIQRLEARWYIDAYERSIDMNPTLLKLAKLDYNYIQSLNQQEMKNLSGDWWNKIELVKKLSFARDRLVACFIWAVGITDEPQYGYCRELLAKAIEMITVVDDIYDVYGTLDELDLLTDAIERWDINDIDQLPHYMKLCFVALYNFVNEMVYHILKEQNINVLPQLKKTWVDLAKASVIEAKWYASGYKPTLEEFLNVALVTITGPLVSIQAYILTANPIDVEALEFLMSTPEILRLSSIIFRMADDGGTSSDELKRGDVPKSIQCYMSDTGVTEEVAREHVKDLIRKHWKVVNTLSQFSDIPLSKFHIEVMLNVTKAAHCFYNCGDGFGTEVGETKERFDALVVHPISL